MRQTLALLFTAQCIVCMRVSSLRAQTLRSRHVAVMMADGKGGMPPGIADRLSFQTGGSKVARQEEEALVLWNLVKECYPSEEAAVAAVNKNSLILNPSANSQPHQIESQTRATRLARGCRALRAAPVRRQALQDHGTFELLAGASEQRSPPKSSPRTWVF